MNAGADDYLPKPFTIDALYAAVEARLKKAQTVRQEAEKKLTDLRDNLSLALPHELRTPLNGILAFGEILAHEAGALQPAEIADIGQTIHESGKRLERLVENFVIFAQLELMAADASHLHTLRGKQSENAAGLIEAHARKQAAAATRPGDLQLRLEPATVPMSEEYLVKVVDELVQNAFKFSKAGAPVEVQLQDAGDVLTLAVSDRGRGFSPEQISNVGAYVQFERKLQEQQGLGLGLAIARRLTELHGGTLSIQSDKGQGSRVTLKLPKTVSA